jgi:hypothetical protein
MLDAIGRARAAGVFWNKRASRRHDVGGGKPDILRPGAPTRSVAPTKGNWLEEANSGVLFKRKRFAVIHGIHTVAAALNTQI